jgi:hypothetical protein
MMKVNELPSRAHIILEAKLSKALELCFAKIKRLHIHWNKVEGN